MTLQTFAVRVACVLVAMMSGACTIDMPSKKIDYKSASKERLQPLEVPPDLVRPAGDDRYNVPGATGAAGKPATFSSYTRDREGKVDTSERQVLPANDDARVERAGTQRWLVVKGSPAQLWPLVKDFWQETGFLINVEIPEAGIMETDWAENRARIPQGFLRDTLGRALDTLYSTSERDKFRTRLEQGGQPGTTEIYISHRGMEEVFTTSTQEQTKWQPRRADPELEAEMLRRLMVRLGVQQERARTQVAVAGTTVQRASINRGSSGNTLIVSEQFDRAWRSVGLALDRVGFTVEDRDRANGIYFVRYIDPDADNKTKKDTGLLARLKFWGSSSDAQPRNEQYRILVKEVQAGAEVSVLNKAGTPEQSATSDRILTLLLEQLR